MAENDDNSGAPESADDSAPGRQEDPIDELAHAMGEPFEDAVEPHPVPLIRAIDRGIGVIEQVAVALSLAALIGIAAYKGISAQFLDHDPPWAKHYIWYLVFLVAMSSAALSVQTQQIIKMDFVTRKVSVRTRLVLRLLTHVFAVSVLVFLVYQSWEARSGYEDTDDFFDDRLVLTSLPLAGVLIGVHLLLHAVIDAVYLSKGEAPPEAQVSGH